MSAALSGAVARESREMGASTDTPRAPACTILIHCPCNLYSLTDLPSAARSNTKLSLVYVGPRVKYKLEATAGLQHIHEV